MFSAAWLRYAGFFNRGALLFCRCYAPKAGNLYLGQCTGSRKTGIGARLSKDGRFFVGHWEADKPSGEGVVYLENCSLVQTVVHQPSGEPKYESAKPIPPSARAPPRASAPVDLDDREAVAVLLRAIMADPVGQAHRAIALLEQLRQEGDDMLQAEVRARPTPRLAVSRQLQCSLTFVTDCTHRLSCSHPRWSTCLTSRTVS